MNSHWFCRIRILLFLALLPIVLNGQATLRTIENSLAFKTGFFQVKDEFNYGLVFNGFTMDMNYSLRITAEKYSFNYTSAVSAGLDFKHGIGLAFHIKPVDIFYGFKIPEPKHGDTWIGAYFITSYNWQLYPQLQSGHMFWFSIMELGPRLESILPIKTRRIRISLSNSVMGWTSRPIPSTETTFYSLTFGDFVSNANSNFTFGSFDVFNHTCFKTELLAKPDRKLSIAYEFEYFGYFKEPTLSYLMHSINFRGPIGKTKTILQ